MVYLKILIKTLTGKNIANYAPSVEEADAILGPLEDLAPSLEEADEILARFAEEDALVA